MAKMAGTSISGVALCVNCTSVDGVKTTSAAQRVSAAAGRWSVSYTEHHLASRSRHRTWVHLLLWNRFCADLRSLIRYLLCASSAAFGDKRFTRTLSLSLTVAVNSDTGTVVGDDRLLQAAPSSPQVLPHFCARTGSREVSCHEDAIFFTGRSPQRRRASRCVRLAPSMNVVLHSVRVLPTLCAAFAVRCKR
jgi:hypothetical protein